MLGYEPISGRYFKTEAAKLKAVQADISRQYDAGEKMTLTLNELYEKLGLTPSLMGWNYGFDLHDGPLHIWGAKGPDDGSLVPLVYSLETKLLSTTATIAEPKTADAPAEEEVPKKRRAYSGKRRDHRRMIAIDRTAFFRTLEERGITLWRLCQQERFCRSTSAIYRQVREGLLDAHIVCELAEALDVNVARLTRDGKSSSAYNAHISMITLDGKTNVDPTIAAGLEAAIDEAVASYLRDCPLDENTVIVWRARTGLSKTAT